LLDVVVEKSSEHDSNIIEEEERDHGIAHAEQMMNIQHGQLSQKANNMFRQGTNRYCRAMNTCMCLRQKANFLYQQNQYFAFLKHQ